MEAVGVVRVYSCLLLFPVGAHCIPLVAGDTLLVVHATEPPFEQLPSLSSTLVFLSRA